MLQDVRDMSCLLFLFIGTSLWLGNVLSQQVVDHDPNSSSPPLPEDPVLVTSDSCDWMGSGLDAGGGGRAVVPVYLRCLQGSVRWRYPDNGLRLLLSNPEREFRGCIRIRRSSRPSNTPNVRVAVEEERGQSLRSLYHPADGLDPDLLRCFSSRHKEAVLFIEAIPSHHSQLSGTASIPYQRESVFELDYHLEPVESEKVLQNEMEECRPCTDEELVHAFCASDFLVRGSIRSLVENELLSRSEIVVDIESVVRDSGSPSLAEGKSQQDPASIVLHRPLKCHSRAGIGSTEFLFMGRWELGNPVIRCAPKWSSWKHVRHRVQQSGSSPCRL